MKVLLVNGSPHSKGCTYTALCEVEKELKKAGIDTEIFHIGDKPIAGCIGCAGCASGQHRCIIDDVVNRFLEKAEEADGFIFGSPVYYASANGAMIAFMDRIFYAGSKIFAYKPGACVVSARRAGTTATLDQMNKYLSFSRMPVVSSQYWNMVHGNRPEEVKQDLEGLQIMRVLGRNMAWLLKCIEAGKQAGIPMPEEELKARTNFIR
ncbi:flavodoxin family protein [Anaerolentibacter hominis]|uniref:flavodoxin family protein n=1 Tax=Anaerolentibacter hominis TaxID=3079009 RepID=UPI0031B86A11